jgi:signal peptidase II
MRFLLVTAVVVVIDQISKVVVLNTMYRGQSIPVLGDWFRLTFTENPGMAFGLNFGPHGLITILSIIATVLIAWYMYRVHHAYGPYSVALSMILGGALGNIIDRVFYGVILGYGGLFRGKVVDFIHFNVWRGYIPEGVPLIGGSYMALFPIWNVADMAIVVGVVGILVFQNQFHDRLALESEGFAAGDGSVGSDLAATGNGGSPGDTTSMPEGRDSDRGDL